MTELHTHYNTTIVSNREMITIWNTYKTNIEQVGRYCYLVRVILSPAFYFFTLCMFIFSILM